MAPAPAPAPSMDVEDEGGGGAKNQNMVVVKSETLCTSVIKIGGSLAGAPELVKDEGGDTTECSSSFGDTCSGFDDEADGGEPEVNSHNLACAHGDGPSKPPRRKKVTAEWRNAVYPILWRCQWLELRMKDLSSQVSKYDRELARIKKGKEQQAVSKANGSMSESMQIHIGHGNSIMKRRKRKRHEDNVDASLYMNKHQILSYYYDKQTKGAETDGLLIDDDCSSPVDGGIRGGLDTVTLLDAEDYDIIFEQLTLRDVLLTIDGVQSQVHLLQDRLSKAHSEGENLAFSEDNNHVRGARKRHSTQKRSFSYTNCRYTKPQKKKNLNILLKDDDAPAVAVRPALPDRETDALIKDADRNAEEKSGECTHSREKAITVGLLLGTDNYIPNGHIGDLCKENTDDILIDNQAANEGCQQFEKVKHLPSETCSKGHNSSAPVEVKNTFAPVKVDNTYAPVRGESTSAPVVKQESFDEKSPMMKPVGSVEKQGHESKKKKKKKKGSFSTKKKGKETSKIPAAKNKTESTPSAAKNKTGSTPSAAKQKSESTPSASKEKTESTPSAAMGLETMAARSAGKKRKSGNDSADAKKLKSGNSSPASKKQKTGKSPSASKKQETEKSPTAAKQETESSPTAAKQETESSSSAAKKPETESTPSKMKIETILVAVNSRRSQRVRKPKVFAE